MYETKLKGLVRDLKVINKHLIIRAKSTGVWMSVRRITFSGTLLSSTKFRDLLCVRYNVSPLNLQSHCNGCGTAFGGMQALSCIIVGLVIVCHKIICDKLLYLYRHAFNSAYVRAKPLIYQGHTRYEQEMRQGSDKVK